MKPNGYILLHRDLMNNWVWQDEEFTKGQAWVDLLMLVNHSDNEKVLINNKFISVKRGETITSKLKLAQRWGWSRKKLDKFLGLLESDKMATAESTPHYTTIKVLNYNVYQTNKKDFEQRNAQPKEQQKDNKGNNECTQTSNEVINELNNDNQLKTSMVNYDDIKTFYNSLNNLPNIRTLSTKRKDKIKLRIKEVGLEEFKTALQMCNDIPFLNGSNGGTFIGDLDWVIKNDENILKVLEGKYGDKTKPKTKAQQDKDNFYKSLNDRFDVEGNKNEETNI